jgi:hypothetical protein
MLMMDLSENVIFSKKSTQREVHAFHIPTVLQDVNSCVNGNCTMKGIFQSKLHLFTKYY